VVLGSTGSIGVSCLEVVGALPEQLKVLGMSAHTNWEMLVRQAARWMPKWVTLSGRKRNDILDTASSTPCRVLFGEEGIVAMASSSEADVVVNAIVGAAGLMGTWAALEAGKTVALANKETMVVAGPLVTECAAANGSKIIPVDSEHSAIFQGLQCGGHGAVARVVLTASGGPFRGKSKKELAQVCVDEVLQHPTWRMGRKITVDSASLMNKALEIIEARWLFDLAPDQIEVIIHPESIIHSFVEFQDGSVIAQMSPPDMRLPIQYALTYPERLPGPARRLDWQLLEALHFEQPDDETFPALQLGYEVARRGGTCGAVLNAANEAAVSRFLNGEVSFLDIPRICRKVLDQHHYSPRPTLGELHAIDCWARQEAARWKTGATLNSKLQ
jgi:1-deoxy-D-xylulose-5-phosphate reductoisomerase